MNWSVHEKCYVVLKVIKIATSPEEKVGKTYFTSSIHITYCTKWPDTLPGWEYDLILSGYGVMT